MTALQLTQLTATSCLGRGLEATAAALRAARSGLAPCNFDGAQIDTYVGEVAGLDTVALPDALRRYDCRNNRLAELALRQDDFEAQVRACAARYGSERIGVFLGTSTSGILSTERAYQRRAPAEGALPEDFDYAGTQNSFSVVDFVQRRFGLEGPAVAVCTACSSSAKVFATAERMIGAGWIDAALVGGVDSLCLTTLYGFHSLQLTSPRPCRPFDRARDGLSIGEAAAFALLERPRRPLEADAVLLLGAGESSDAYHMSSPQPQGAGALRAMRAALSAAATEPAQIDYVNLHGTGTPSNDSAESQAICALFGRATPCSSTKGASGHTLGAAGALEAVICALSLKLGMIPAGLHLDELDPAFELNYVSVNRPAPLRRVLSNSFGFGGANCALLFGLPG